MADEYRKELISPSGRTVVSTSERETNDLRFGKGYREVDTAKPSPASVDKPTAPEPKPVATSSKETP